jgi:hypothetical protein
MIPAELLRVESGSDPDDRGRTGNAAFGDQDLIPLIAGGERGRRRSGSDPADRGRAAGGDRGRNLEFLI